MKKILISGIAVICALCLISWAETGHKAVAKIAENHLTPKSKEAVHNLLGFESMADVSSYADEVRTIAQYKYTGAFHYVNLPAGYSFEEFSRTIKTMKEDNVYQMLFAYIRDLQNPAKTKIQKAVALKFIIHLVGDLHQPMHVSNAADKGGSGIAISFNGSHDNLHNLWDGVLIDHEGLNYKQMATNYDTATPAEIQKWQSDDVMVWLWESYQISTILYQEAAENPDFKEDYYQSHLPILQKRVEKAGIRLAGLLNAVFDKPDTTTLEKKTP